MASKKITVTIPEKQLTQVRALVKTGASASVSAFVQKAVALALDDLAGWEASLEALLEKTGGPLQHDEQAWLERILGHSSAA